MISPKPKHSRIVESHPRPNGVKKTIYPGGAFETFAYDARGRLETMVDRKNVTTTYAYDDLSGLTGKTFSDSTPAFSYTYDAAGRMLTANGTDTLSWPTISQGNCSPSRA